MLGLWLIAFISGIIFAHSLGSREVTGIMFIDILTIVSSRIAMFISLFFVAVYS